MASMPGYHVSKGPFGFLDGMFDGSDATKYADAIAKLQGSLQTAAEDRWTPGDPRVQHFKTDWLGTGNNWGQLKPEDTLRQGLIRAITKAKATTPPKPMEFFWVCALDHDFHIYYCDGPHHVTVIVFTPPPLDVGGNPHITVDPSALTAPTDPPLFVVKKKDWENTGPGQQYPSAVTTLVPQTSPPVAEIIERQIMREP